MGISARRGVPLKSLTPASLFPGFAVATERTRLIALSASVALVAIFTADVRTPASFSYWPYGLPIMLAALTTSERLTGGLVIGGLLFNIVGSTVDWVAGDVPWTREYILNRVVATTSTLLTGFLAVAVQRATARSARIGAVQLEHARELAVSSAADRILNALSTDHLVATIASEALNIFDGSLAMWIPGRTSRSATVARRAGDAIELESQTLGPEFAALVTEVASHPKHRIEWTTLRNDPGAAAALGTQTLLSIPVAGSTSGGGTLLVVPARDEVDDTAIPSAHSFARIAASAMDEAELRHELASQNQSLKDRQQVIQDLVDAISHDVRTPLEALSMTLQQAIAGQYGPLPNEYAEVVSESRISIEEINRLAETLLLVARFEAGAGPVSEGPFALDVLVEELIVEYRSLAAARAIEISADIEANAIVEGSRPSVRRAVSNLIANGVRHTPPGGHIRLTVRRRESAIEVVVDDDGYGVAEEVRPMLFQRFARGVGTGSGLGLYIVRRVAENMGGAAAYEPRLPRGSSFRILLPAYGLQGAR